MECKVATAVASIRFIPCTHDKIKIKRPYGVVANERF